MRECTEELFLSDVATHQMTLIRDDGLHRHVRFKKPDSGDQYFDLITWPGALCYTGDMGTYVFSRIPDMFGFFRFSNREGPLRINEGYWAEKLLATDRCDGHREYSADTARKYIESQLDQFKEFFDLDVEDGTGALQFAELKEAVEADVLAAVDDGEHALREAMADFEHGGRNWFPDYWERRFDEYTLRFTWCCYAIAWGIRQYDDRKSTPAAIYSFEEFFAKVRDTGWNPTADELRELLKDAKPMPAIGDSVRT